MDNRNRHGRGSFRNPYSKEEVRVRQPLGEYVLDLEEGDTVEVFGRVLEVDKILRSDVGATLTLRYLEEVRPSVEVVAFDRPDRDKVSVEFKEYP